MSKGWGRNIFGLWRFGLMTMTVKFQSIFCIQYFNYLTDPEFKVRINAFVSVPNKIRPDFKESGLSKSRLKRHDSIEKLINVKIILQFFVFIPDSTKKINNSLNFSFYRKILFRIRLSFQSGFIFQSVNFWVLQSLLLSCTWIKID